MRALSIFSLLLLSCVAAQASESINVAGVWVTESRNAIVEIIDCGNGTPCGKVAWVNAPAGVILRDDQNPDESLRDQPLVGSDVLWDFEVKGDKWSGGKIYDAQSGKTYKSKLELMKDGTLKVKGCVGPICQGQIWTPVKLISKGL